MIYSAKPTKKIDNRYKDAFDIVESLCQQYKTTIRMSYGVKKNASIRSRVWIVQVMENEFIHENPLKALGKAFEMILAANSVKVDAKN